MARRVRPNDQRSVADEVAAEVRVIYQELAARPIQRSCTQQTECCRFRLTGRTPFLTKAEALVAARAIRASGRTKLPSRTDGACPLLGDTGRCMIYEGRPFGCRTHFCPAAGGPYARKEVSDLIHRLEDLSLKLGGRDAEALPGALQQALQTR
jgi:Fe-S-cluster containining protein